MYPRSQVCDNMFRKCSAFNQNISNWDVSSVTKYAKYVLSGDNLINQPIGNWDVSNVTSMNTIFQNE